MSFRSPLVLTRVVKLKLRMIRMFFYVEIVLTND